MGLARDEALWLCDIAAHQLHRFLPATGELRGWPFPTGVGSAAGYGGRPDGAAVDRSCYWVAMYEGGCVLRYSPAGELLREVCVPALCPTMPRFGGPDLKTVYVTSASLHRPPEELARLPRSGRVFSFAVDVPGLPIAFADL